jgi:hypothetical protein
VSVIFLSILVGSIPITDLEIQFTMKHLFPEFRCACFLLDLKKCIFILLFLIFLIFIPATGQSQEPEIEYLQIKKGWNWISFPRLEREDNDSVLAKPLLEKIIPLPSYLKMVNRPLQDPNPMTFELVYNIPIWSGNLTSIKSTFGYKLETNNPDNSILPLRGSILNPETEIKIYDGHENWVGYFLPETQSPFEAIPEYLLPHLRTISGQYWTCLNYAFITPPPKASANSIGEWRCLCNQGKVELEYNDMIILILGNTTEQVFSWNRIGGSGTIIKKEAPEYFQYSEQPNYEAIIIDLDSIDMPDEIGAFAGDSCIGATKVMPGDTSAMICAYTQGFEGEEISFELIYSTKGSRPVIDNYLVFNNQTRINQNGKIKIGEKQPFYLVSFSKNTEQTPLINLPSLHCLPNPSSAKVTITYLLPYESKVKICITNILGKEMMCLDQQNQAAGEYQVEINTTWLPSGYYLVSMSSKNQTCTNKMLIIH